MLWMRIDKKKVAERRDKVGITTWNELGEKTTPRGLSTRTLYDILDSQDWSTKQVYALCEILECTPVDILAFDMKTTEVDNKGKALAPSGPLFGIPVKIEIPEFQLN